MITFCTIFSACEKTDKEYKININNTDIAYVSLFTYSGEGETSYGLVNLGHSFLSIENISTSDITLYNYTIPAGETITIGTWSLSKHFGIWFNIESNYIVNRNKYDGRYSVTTGVSVEDINKLNDFMSSHDKWGCLKNCSYFAQSFWNEIAEESEFIPYKPIFTPKYLEEEIQKFEEHEYNREIITNDTCYYFDGDTFQEFHFEGEE